MASLASSRVQPLPQNDSLGVLHLHNAQTQGRVGVKGKGKGLYKTYHKAKQLMIPEHDS